VRRDVCLLDSGLLKGLRLVEVMQMPMGVVRMPRFVSGKDGSLCLSRKLPGGCHRSPSL
jgi:hypothetical protein